MFWPFTKKKKKVEEVKPDAAGTEPPLVPVAVGVDPAAPTASDAKTPPRTMKQLFPDKHSIYGLRTLHEPSSFNVDIVFVHGLMGSPDKTFLYKDKGTEVYWPVHLLPQKIPNARILTFGYDADVARFLAPTGEFTIAEHANILVGALARLKSDTPSGPNKTIFVAHSLGGLVVKRAMVLSASSAQQHLLQVSQDTVAIAFFGTPHRGSNLAPFAKLFAELLRASRSRVNPEILEPLKRNSQILADLEQSFENWTAKRKDDDFIVCFSEAIEVLGVGWIVTAESSKIGRFTQEKIRANHMDMVKFANANVQGFQQAVGELQRWISRVGQTEG